MINIYNMDCLEAMSKMEDNAFELAIVDPPYGINISKTGNVGGEKLAKVKDYGKKEWDNNIPNKSYFEELKRISKNQIIFGGNYMIEHLKNTPCFLIWDKNNTGNFADAELAWTSFDTATRIFKSTWNGMLQHDMKNKEIRIHPTQKPIRLYEWILMNYAKKNDKILDTHLGSGSSAIAAHNLGYDFTGYELDNEYFKATKKRIDNHTAQLRIL